MPLPCVAAIAAGALAAGFFANDLTTLPGRLLPALSIAVGLSDGAGEPANERTRALDAARRQLREEATRSLRASLDPIFAAMKARVPHYTDWYYSYPTKYLMMAHAFVAATDYTAGRLAAGGPSGPGVVRAITTHLTNYMNAQYRAQVVQPRTTEARLAAAFAAAEQKLGQRWTRLAEGRQPARLRFVADLYPGPPSRGGSAAAPGTIWGAPLRAIEPERAAKSAGGNPGEFAGVIVGLFSELAGPVAAQAQVLALGIAKGTAAGAVAAPPIAGVLGFAATIGVGMLADQLEESLTGAGFEQKIDGAISAAEVQIEARMKARLDRRIDAWYAEALTPAGRARQVASDCCRSREG